VDAGRGGGRLAPQLFRVGLLLHQDFVDRTGNALAAVSQLGADLIVGCRPGKGFKRT